MLYKTDERRTAAPERPTRALGRRPRPAAAATAAVALGGAYCWFTAGTTPFTARANLAVGAALVVAAVMAAVEALTGRPWPPRGPDRARARASLWAWWVAIGLLVAWELFNYVQSPRHSYPTVSSIYDHLARWQWAKALVIAAWLVLGAAIVAAFAEERTRSHRR
jgi:MFS family permease